jgi:hypothetical protein
VGFYFWIGKNSCLPHAAIFTALPLPSGDTYGFFGLWSLLLVDCLIAIFFGLEWQGQ